jgi:hypothetical protein
MNEALQSPDFLARSRLIIQEWWDEPEKMWELLEVLEREYGRTDGTK